MRPETVNLQKAFGLSGVLLAATLVFSGCAHQKEKRIEKHRPVETTEVVEKSDPEQNDGSTELHEKEKNRPARQVPLEKEADVEREMPEREREEEALPVTPVQPPPGPPGSRTR